jgi:hypothetical protein
MPESLRASVNPRFRARTRSLLAGGQEIDEDSYEVEFPFDGQTLDVEATFAPGGEILVGTNLLWNYLLEINFIDMTVRLQKLL